MDLLNFEGQGLDFDETLPGGVAEFPARAVAGGRLGLADWRNLEGGNPAAGAARSMSLLRF